MVVGAAPTWFADNVLPIALGTLLVLTVLVVRLVQKLTVRLALLGAIAAVALFAYVNRAPLEQCAETCSCAIADRDVTLPLCSTDLDPRD